MRSGRLLDLGLRDDAMSYESEPNDKTGDKNRFERRLCSSFNVTARTDLETSKHVAVGGRPEGHPHEQRQEPNGDSIS